jgi:nucleotide-binding universal stress UspA family protein
MSNEAKPAEYQAIAALDLSELGDRALDQALRMSAAHESAELHVIIVGSKEEDSIRLPGEDGDVLPVDEANEFARNHVAKLIAKYHEEHGGINMEKIAVYVATGHPAERIVALATAIDASVVVMGTHGRTGLKRWVLGSVAEEVVRRAPCSVFVLRPSDFLEGEKLPDIQPPLREGEHSLKPFHHSPTYHYVDRNSRAPGRIMPAT